MGLVTPLGFLGGQLTILALTLHTNGGLSELALLVEGRFPQVILSQDIGLSD